MLNENKLSTGDRIKLLTKAHKKSEGDIYEFNNLWKVNFITMTDQEFREELQYIEHLLKENYHEFLS